MVVLALCVVVVVVFGVVCGGGGGVVVVVVEGRCVLVWRCWWWELGRAGARICGVVVLLCVVGVWCSVLFGVRHGD